MKKWILITLLIFQSLYAAEIEINGNFIKAKFYRYGHKDRIVTEEFSVNQIVSLSHIEYKNGNKDISDRTYGFQNLKDKYNGYYLHYYSYYGNETGIKTIEISKEKYIKLRKRLRIDRNSQ